MSAHVHSAEAAGAASAAQFLLRSGMDQRKVEPQQFGTIRSPIFGSRGLLLGGGATAAVFGAVLGAYLVFADDPSNNADAMHLEPPLARAQHDTAPAAPQSMKPVSEQLPKETLLQESDIPSRSEGDLDAPRVVRTEPFQPDPSVWANVRKFVPLPPEQVPILDNAPVQLPANAPAVPDARRVIGTHHEPARAHAHAHQARAHPRVRRSRTRAVGGAPSDVAGQR